MLVFKVASGKVIYTKSFYFEFTFVKVIYCFMGIWIKYTIIIKYFRIYLQLF